MGIWTDYTIVGPRGLNILKDSLLEIDRQGVRGQIVIGGTFKGGDAMMFRSVNPKRIITVIDSFQGLAAPSPEDQCPDGKCRAPIGSCNTKGLEVFKNNFKEAGIREPNYIYPIFITPESLADIPRCKIALLWLDLDHYAPTKACLDKFLPWMMPRGIVLTHDYGWEHTPGIKKACDLFGTWKRYPQTTIAVLTHRF